MIVFDDLSSPGGGILFGDLDTLGDLPFVLVVSPPAEGVVDSSAEIPFQLAKFYDVAQLVAQPFDVSLRTEQNFLLGVDVVEGVAEGQDQAFRITLLVTSASGVGHGRNVLLRWSEAPAIPYSGKSIAVAEVDPSGLTQWVHYIPVKKILVDDEGQLNRFDDDGALAVQTVDDPSGLRAWADYIPVVVVDRDDAGKWRYDDSGFLPVCEVIEPA